MTYEEELSELQRWYLRDNFGLSILEQREKAKKYNESVKALKIKYNVKDGMSDDPVQREKDRVNYEAERKVLVEWCIKESDRCMKIEGAPGNLDERPSFEMKKVFRKYNIGLLNLKAKYGIDMASADREWHYYKDEDTSKEQ